MCRCCSPWGEKVGGRDKGHQNAIKKCCLFLLLLSLTLPYSEREYVCAFAWRHIASSFTVGRREHYRYCRTSSAMHPSTDKEWGRFFKFKKWFKSLASVKSPLVKLTEVLLFATLKLRFHSVHYNCCPSYTGWVRNHLIEIKGKIKLCVTFPAIENRQDLLRSTTGHSIYEKLHAKSWGVWLL